MQHPCDALLIACTQARHGLREVLRSLGDLAHVAGIDCVGQRLGGLVGGQRAGDGCKRGRELIVASAHLLDLLLKVLQRIQGGVWLVASGVHRPGALAHELAQRIVTQTGFELLTDFQTGLPDFVRMG